MEECNNDSLFYDANLILERVGFWRYEKTKLKFNGKYLRRKKMHQGNINQNDKGVFNYKRIFQEGKYKRYYLAYKISIK